MEAPLLNALIIVATGATLIKVALFEWEEVMRAWRRVRRQSKSKDRSKSDRACHDAVEAKEQSKCLFF